MDAIENAAVRMGGLASRRSVSDSVKKLAQEKLNRDRKLIQNAIATRNIAPTTDPPMETMEGKISHIRLKTVRDDSTVQFRNLKKARNAAEADKAQKPATGLLTKISRLPNLAILQRVKRKWLMIREAGSIILPKLAILQRVKRKWLISGIVGSIIIAIASALLFSLLSKNEPITPRSLEQAKIKPSFSNLPKEGFDEISIKQPTTDRASSDTVDKGSRVGAKQRSRRDISKKNKSSKDIIIAKTGNRNASSNRTDRRALGKKSSNITETHGIPDNPFKPSSKRKRSLRKKKKTSSRTASGGRIPDNPFD
jgi:hypothetical protein